MPYKKNLYYLFFLLTVLSLIGCGSLSSWKQSDRTYTVANASYDISLISIERPTGAEKIYGEPKIETVFEEGIPAFSFEDEMVRIKWRPAPVDISFVINNKTDRPVLVIWDESSFIDEKGVIHKVTHSGIGYEERNNSHPPIVINALGTFEDFLHPADCFKKEEPRRGKSYKQEDYWKRTSFLPTQIKGKAEELRTKAEPLVGKTFHVVLALQIDNVRNDYVYTFKINKVDVTEKEEQQEKSPKEGKGGGKSSRGRTY
ncbi:MAG: hypothetical protein ACLP9S_00375 [Syntrophales bacterium]